MCIQDVYTTPLPAVQCSVLDQTCCLSTLTFTCGLCLLQATLATPAHPPTVTLCIAAAAARDITPSEVTAGSPCSCTLFRYSRRDKRTSVLSVRCGHPLMYAVTRRLHDAVVCSKASSLTFGNLVRVKCCSRGNGWLNADLNPWLVMSSSSSSCNRCRLLILRRSAKPASVKAWQSADTSVSNTGECCMAAVVLSLQRFRYNVLSAGKLEASG